MTQGKLQDSLSKAAVFLKSISYLKSKGVKNCLVNGVSSEFRKASLKQDYFEMFLIATKNFDYDILLFDDSIFQFTIGATADSGALSIRYAFFQNPKEHISYKGFLLMSEFDEDHIDEIGDSFYEDYDQFLNEQALNQEATMVRFDVDSSNHRPCIHSAAHFHFGHLTDIRVPCSKVLTPFGFIVFILKHCYYDDWKGGFGMNRVDFMNIVKIQKDGSVLLKDLDPRLWGSEEEQDLYLS